MRSVFDLTQPRDEVLRGELSGELFAARLKDVVEGRAEPVYGDPDRFFGNTYPTAGLRTLLREALGRLTGQSPTNSPIIRLETSFGGGKTHNLIALYHAARGRLAPELAAHFLDDVALPAPDRVLVAGVVASADDPLLGINHPEDGVITYTPWGELAYQLGGRAGYALVEASDRDRVAPGASLFERLIGQRPTLIMLDEIAATLRKGSAVATRMGKSTLAEQTTAFLMSLMEFVASQRQVVLVLTLASEEDAFSKETANLREALRVSARQERVLTPAAENEISSIVVHRLFAHVDRDGAAAVIARYGEYYRELERQEAPIHDRAGRADYLNEFALSYPFHPELIRALNLKVATIPNFQRTRGALRLLAGVVRRLWQQRPANTWLIH
nr:ATP-binding protein [Promineifilum sp.]